MSNRNQLSAATRQEILQILSQSKVHQTTEEPSKRRRSWPISMAGSEFLDQALQNKINQFAQRNQTTRERRVASI